MYSSSVVTRRCGWVQCSGMIQRMRAITLSVTRATGSRAERVYDGNYCIASQRTSDRKVKAERTPAGLLPLPSSKNASFHKGWLYLIDLHLHLKRFHYAKNDEFFTRLLRSIQIAILKFCSIFMLFACRSTDETQRIVSSLCRAPIRAEIRKKNAKSEMRVPHIQSRFIQWSGSLCIWHHKKLWNLFFFRCVVCVLEIPSHIFGW